MSVKYKEKVRGQIDPALEIVLRQPWPRRIEIARIFRQWARQLEAQSSLVPPVSEKEQELN